MEKESPPKSTETQFMSRWGGLIIPAVLFALVIAIVLLDIAMR